MDIKELEELEPIVCTKCGEPIPPFHFTGHMTEHQDEKQGPTHHPQGERCPHGQTPHICPECNPAVTDAEMRKHFEEPHLHEGMEARFRRALDQCGNLEITHGELVDGTTAPLYAFIQAELERAERIGYERGLNEKEA